jgi:hypothetical protein
MSESSKASSNAGRFKSKIDWPEDQELVAMVNDRGLSETAKMLGINPSSLHGRMKNRKLRHNRMRKKPANNAA